MSGEQLSRVPKGFDAADPAADLLRYKQFLYYVELPADLATTPALFREILARFRAMALHGLPQCAFGLSKEENRDRPVHLSTSCLSEPRVTLIVTKLSHFRTRMRAPAQYMTTLWISIVLVLLL